jgi:hypothetical protein
MGEATTGMPATCAQCGERPIIQSYSTTVAFCPRCGTNVCWMDGVRLDRHPMCRACRIPVGRRHFTKSLDAMGMCPACALARR